MTEPDWRKPAVLNVSQNYHLRGGSDRVFFMTADLLAERGHQVIPFAAAHPQNRPTEWSSYFPLAADFEHPGPADLGRFIYSRPAARAIRRLIRDCQPDVAHLHIYYGKLTSSILAPLREAGIPIVQTLHEYKLICPVYTLLSNERLCEACQGRHFWRALPRKCNRNSLARTLLSVTESYTSRFLGSAAFIDHFIAVSDFLRAKMITHGIPPQKISTIHNFIKTAGVEPNSQPGDYFLYLGRLERYKGLYTLLEAAAPLDQTPLLLVGDGPAYEPLATLIERKNLEHVRLLGFKQGREVAQLIRGSLCTLLPSEWYETFGMAVLEAFAHARPVIASRIGGIPEVVANGVDGWLVNPGNVLDLREKMAWMAAHPRQAADMGMGGRRKAEEQFSPGQHYEKLLAVYRSVIQKDV